MERPQVVKFAELPNPLPHSLFAHKARQWLAVFGRDLGGWTLGAIGAWTSGLLVAASAIYLLQWAGFQEEAGGEALTSIAYAFATLAGGVLLFLFVGIRSALRASEHIRKLGRWDRNAFIFVEPVTVWAGNATAEQNETRIVFTVPEAAPYSVVRCVLSSPTNSRLLKATLQSPFYCIKRWHSLISNREWPTFADGDLNAAVRLGPNREAYLEWLLAANAVPTQLRLKVLSFEVQGPGVGEGLKYFHLHVSQPANDVDFYGV